MAVPKGIHDAKGSWTGESQLNLAYLPPDQRVSKSASKLHVYTDAKGHYAMVTYTWAHEGKPQEGTMIVCMAGETKAVEIGWADSYHMNAGVLHLVGKETETGAVRTKGSFLAGEETWGWTVDFDLVGDTLTLTMDVIPADRAAEWAVKAVYKRE